MTNLLVKRYGMRCIGVVGAVLFALPNIVLAFVDNIYEIAVISFIQGIGLGFVFTILNTNFNAYFVKRRSMVRSGLLDKKR